MLCLAAHDVLLQVLYQAIAKRAREVQSYLPHIGLGLRLLPRQDLGDLRDFLVDPDVHGAQDSTVGHQSQAGQT
jgi:hypothetical protein